MNLGYYPAQYAEVGKLKISNNKVMYHLAVKPSDMFDQNHPHLTTKRKKRIPVKNAFDLKVKVITKIKISDLRNKKMWPNKIWAEASLAT